MAPLVSVVMPVYNQEPYLAETIESVLAQSFEGFEFLIADDGSTDNSAQIIRTYAAKDDRIRAYYESNSGKCATTNRLVGRAQGLWCAFLDADDVMLPKRLEKQWKFHMTYPEVDASSCHCYYIDSQGHPLGIQRYRSLKNINEALQATAEHTFIHCAFTGLMIRRLAYLQTGGLKAQFWPSEDFELANRLLDEGFLLVIIQEVLMKYRIHQASITARKPFHMFDMTGWIMYCFGERRAGRPDISFEEFMALRHQEPWWVKWSRKRHNYSQIFLRDASFALFCRAYLSFSWLAILGSCLAPHYALTLIRNRLKE